MRRTDRPSPAGVRPSCAPRLLLVHALIVAGCADGAMGPDDGARRLGPDAAGPARDAAPADAVPPDAAAPPDGRRFDAGAPDAGPDPCAECTAPANAAVTCEDGVCGFVCDEGYGDCDGARDNGCERSLRTRADCGGCGVACTGDAYCGGTACRTVQTAWSRLHGGDDAQHVTGLASTTGVSGGLFLAGHYDNELTMGSERFTAVDGPYLRDVDAFVTALTPLGSPRWTVALGGPRGDRIGGLAPAPGGDAYVALDFEDRLERDPALLSRGGRDLLLLRLDGDTGELRWVRHFGGRGNERVSDLALGPDGRACMVGSLDGPLRLGEITLAAVDGEDVLVACLEQDGTPAWARVLWGVADDRGTRITASDDTVYVTGRLRGDLHIGSGTMLAASEGSEPFVAAFDAADGTLRWGRGIEGGHGWFRALAPAGEGHVLVGGALVGSLRMGDVALASTGEQDAFVVSLDPEGRPAWGARYGGADDGGGALGPVESIEALVQGADGTVYATGGFFGDFEAGRHAFASAGRSDVFVLGLGDRGRVRWARSYGAPLWDLSAAVVSPRPGEIVVAGEARGAIDFGDAIREASTNDAFVLALTD